MLRAAWTRPLATIAVAAAPLFMGVAPAHAQNPDTAAAEPDEASVKKAQTLFLKGSDLYKAKKYDQALEQFRASYEAVPSPNSHLFIARCLNDMGRHTDAYLEFDKVVEEADERAKTEDRYAPTRDTARTERDDVARKIALVTVNLTGAAPGTSVQIGSTPVPQDRWGKPFPVEPGTVEVSVQSGGKQVAQESLSLAAGETRDVSLNAAPAPVMAPENTSGKKPPYRTLAYVAGGVGVVGLGMFTVAGIMSQGTYSDLKDQCGEGPCPASLADDVSAGKTQQTVANLGLALGIVGVAAGATLFVLSLKQPKADEGQPAATAKIVVGPSYAGVYGQF